MVPVLNPSAARGASSRTGARSPTGAGESDVTIDELIGHLETIAPTDLAEEWDNVGLLVGSRERELRGPVLFTIDFTEPVLAEAKAKGAGMVIAYHPPLFRETKRLTGDNPLWRTILGAIESGMAIYSPHTALDATPGGVTDWLCGMLGPEPAALEDEHAARAIGDRRALQPHSFMRREESHKIVTFVPKEHAEQVRNALASIGAGRIGDYSLCSYNLEGYGTFFGGESTNPAVGEAGRLETEPELRMEMVCPRAALPLAAAILREFHPYEEPAWDVYEMAAKPDRSVGLGRRITLDRPAPPEELARRLKKGLGVDAVKLAEASSDPIERIGVCPGAGASLLDAAIADDCQAFVTGEMRHHEVAAAVARGCSIILAGHTNTERGYLPIFAKRLKELAPGVETIVSERDRSPFRTL